MASKVQSGARWYLRGELSISRTDTQIALAMEMHLLLTPITLAVLCGLTMLVMLGPHMFRFLAVYDFNHVANIAALVLALFPLWTAWVLGTQTLRGERYTFGGAFWLALAASAGAAYLAVTHDVRLVLLGLAPVSLFMAHMTLLQARLRTAPTPITAAQSRRQAAGS